MPAQINSPGPASPAYQQPPPGAQRPNGGACRCPRVTSLDCTCEWDELISMITHLAYGADRGYALSVAPAIAIMAHDMIVSLLDRSMP